MNLPDGNWHVEPISNDLIQAERINQVLVDTQTSFQHALIIDGECFGRSLILDGKTQSTELDEFIYHETLVHPVMISSTKLPTNILIAGGGEGATLREVLKHPSVKKVTMVDIDEQVIKLSCEFLPKHHMNSFDNPKLSLIIADAFEYVKNTKELYDVAIIDVPDPLESGPAHKIFTKEFYEYLKNILSPDGILVAQSGATGPSFSDQSFTAVQKTISQVFKYSIGYHTFVPSFGSTWGFVTGSDVVDPSLVSIDFIDTYLSKNNISDLKMYDGETHKSLFYLPKYLRASLVSEKRIITENNPLFLTFDT
jgi:spermidine synthase